jgi:hypothetical protein
VFHDAAEPLDPDDWLRTIESKFGLLQCSDQQKTLFVAQQLEGPAGAWWANYTATLAAFYQVSWNEFKEVFRPYHIPEGLMERKAKEFAALTQDNRNVHEYSKRFNQLALYAPDEVNTKEKRKKRFLKGLNADLRHYLRMHTAGSFTTLISNALVAEDSFRQLEAEKKRKAIASGSSRGPPQKYHLVYHGLPPQRSGYRPPQP